MLGYTPPQPQFWKALVERETAVTPNVRVENE